MSSKIGPEHLRGQAIVYVRQSSPGQVTHHVESQRVQYGLQARARRLGFERVEVIDDDLGRSGSGTVHRPGFERLVAKVCAGEAGAVFCSEASRLARNGRDWHSLVDLCALVGTLIIDLDGAYDARVSNDRLLLGLKGSLSEYELTVLHQRSYEAMLAKARRGELRFELPVGLVWTEQDGIELEPDRRVQQAIRLVFDKFVELGSVRQVLMWLVEEGISLPRLTCKGRRGRRIEWLAPSYHTVLAIIRSPLYAGAYVFGRSRAKTRVVDGRARRTRGHEKDPEAWTVLIRDHHPGYVTWEQYERHQAMLAENTHMKGTTGRRSGRGGQSLLTGLLRCARCGRKLHSLYGRYRRYECRMANRAHAAPRCIGFSAHRVEQAVVEQMLLAVQPDAVEIALEAAQQARQRNDERTAALGLEVEQARYEVTLAARRYEAVDPDNRLVATELEARWNRALERVEVLEAKLDESAPEDDVALSVDRASLLALAQDLDAVWHAPTASMRAKQRVTQLLINEIVVDLDDERYEVVLLIHWRGGRHTKLRTPRPKCGQHRHRTSADAEDVIRRMAGRWPDERIAATLNRLQLRTGVGNTWTASRVYSVRKRLRLVGDSPGAGASSIVTMREAARRLGVGPWVVRRLVQRGILPATQVVHAAPWEIEETALDSDAVREALLRHRTGQAPPRGTEDAEQNLAIPGT